MTCQFQECTLEPLLYDVNPGRGEGVVIGGGAGCVCRVGSFSHVGFLKMF